MAYDENTGRNPSNLRRLDTRSENSKRCSACVILRIINGRNSRKILGGTLQNQLKNDQEKEKSIPKNSKRSSAKHRIFSCVNSLKSSSVRRLPSSTNLRALRTKSHIFDFNAKISERKFFHWFFGNILGFQKLLGKNSAQKEIKEKFSIKIPKIIHKIVFNHDFVAFMYSLYLY